MKSRRLNEYLKEKRVTAGLSQAEVAKALGYTSPQFISNWERGLVDPPLSVLGSLVDLYSLSRDEVINLVMSDLREEVESSIKVRGNQKKRTKTSTVKAPTKSSKASNSRSSRGRKTERGSSRNLN